MAAWMVKNRWSSAAFAADMAAKLGLPAGADWRMGLLQRLALVLLFDLLLLLLLLLSLFLLLRSFF